jgi:hypothetical protein
MDSRFILLLQEAINLNATNIQATDFQITALMYYQYRLAGCPYGDNLAGIAAWNEIMVYKPYVEFCNKEYVGKTTNE